jgi:hypothetical protein
VIQRGEPALLLAHWTGVYFNGAETGFKIFQEVVQRPQSLAKDSPEGRNALGPWKITRAGRRGLDFSPADRIGGVGDREPALPQPGSRRSPLPGQTPGRLALSRRVVGGICVLGR